MFLSFRKEILSKIRITNPNILEDTNSQITKLVTNSQITQFFLYGDKNFIALTSFNIILSSTIDYILATKQFDEPLFH